MSLRRPLAVSVSPQQPDRIVNPRLARRDKRLLLTYDLTGEADAYSVELQLSTDGGKTFEPLPETVAGAVGNEVAPGSDKQLVWTAIEDFPKGFSGTGNQLRLAVEESSGNPLYWVLGGALASGAVAAAIGVAGGKRWGWGRRQPADCPPQPPENRWALPKGEGLMMWGDSTHAACPREETPCTTSDHTATHGLFSSIRSVPSSSGAPSPRIAPIPSVSSQDPLPGRDAPMLTPTAPSPTGR
ncbi:MAG: hypothetical protein BRD55_05880 [Bacteroidetes bacterium SW_9_63_38]|nr:MAG: hypothetical protein BRD55_05880 [Bacteroidetes bacterium SW_9_63_38]